MSTPSDPDDYLFPLPSTDPKLPESKKVKRKLTPRPLNAPDQLAFFQALHGTPVGIGYTVAVLESLPRFVLGGKLRYTRQAKLYRTGYKVGDQHYPAWIVPALVQRDKDSDELFAVLPGQREELVMRVLIEMFAEQHMSRLYEARIAELRYGRINLTLTDLQTRLRARNKEYKISELRESLIVMKRAESHVKCPGVPDIYDNYLTSVYFAGETLDDGETLTHCVVFLNPATTAAILRLAVWPIDNDKVCRLNLSLARWLATRISNRWRQAKQGDAQALVGYSLLLSTILEEACLRTSGKTPLKEYARRVRDALAELKEAGYLAVYPKSYDEELIYAQPNGGRPAMVDVKWTIYLSMRFTDEIVAGCVEMDRRREEQKRLLQNVVASTGPKQLE